MIDLQPDGDGFSSDALFADLSQQCVGTQIEAPAAFRHGHDARSEQITAL